MPIFFYFYILSSLYISSLFRLLHQQHYRHRFIASFKLPNYVEKDSRLASVVLGHYGAMLKTGSVHNRIAGAPYALYCIQLAFATANLIPLCLDYV